MVGPDQFVTWTAMTLTQRIESALGALAAILLLFGMFPWMYTKGLERQRQEHADAERRRREWSSKHQTGRRQSDIGGKVSGRTDVQNGMPEQVATRE